MVWGFYPPSTTGRFTPGAEFEVGEDGKGKYELRLNSYFHGLSDAEKDRIREKMGDRSSYSRYVDSLLWSRPSHRYSLGGAYHESNLELEEWQVPRSLVVTRPDNRYFRLGDFFGGIEAFVSRALRDIILALEPDVHRFFPIEVTNPFDKDGEDREFFLMIVGQYIDAFNPSLSDSKCFTKSEKLELYNSSPTKRYFDGLAMSTERMKGAHLWSELRFINNMFCISDELKEAIDSSGLEIPKHHRMREV